MSRQQQQAERAAETLAEFLSIAEACHVLGKPYVTTYGWVVSGKLRAVRVGRTYLVDPVSVEALRAERETANER